MAPLPLPDSEVLNPQMPVAVAAEDGAGELPYPAEQARVLRGLLAGKRLAYFPMTPTASGDVTAAAIAQRMEVLFGMNVAPLPAADYLLEFQPTGEHRLSGGSVRTTYSLNFYATGELKPLFARRFMFDMKMPSMVGVEGEDALVAVRSRAVWSALVYGGLFDGLAVVLPR